jgi:hypothetical protein
MTRTVGRAGVAAPLLTALLLATAPAVAGCSADPTCDDVDGLQRRLDGMAPDDPDYNTTVEDLDRAAADCNG